MLPKNISFYENVKLKKTEFNLEPVIKNIS